ncbi:helix-turn-helix transcriptional regulator [Kitasatospora sp. NPDC048545]|uniref:helix-turn-helix domain-containing protein n=1 Tax=Kitasatospora sp. NPDC048545 TaxID=3157208 RepID=UPI0033E131EB
MKETSEFALLLQELKSRSGLSYGALAKRLHLSTSTLHRYCNGDVTPTEFAPLDQLARLCRATPQELVELYRLWVIAQAARGSRKPPPLAEAKARPLTPETEASPADEASPASGTTREAAATPDPGGTRDADGTRDAGAAAGAETTAAPAPVVPPRRARRRGAIAAVTVIVVLATIGAVATNLRAHPGGDSDPAVTRSAGAGPAAGSPAPGVQSPPPSPSSGTASAAASDSASASDSTGAGAGPSGPTGGADPTPSAPITVTVTPSGWDTACDQYVVNRPPSEVPRPPAIVDVPRWAAQVGAVPGHYQSIALTVQGTGSDTVVLTALNVRVTRVSAPLAWNAYSMGEGCGGGVGKLSYDLDLDVARPRPVVTRESHGLPVKVSASDPEVIEVSAETTSHDVSWYLELEWSSGNRRGTLPIDLGHGVPFRTSAVKGRPLYVYPIGGHGWEPSPYRH